MAKIKARIIVVAGGAGFVGSHLCGRLLSMGRKVMCVDNLTTGRKSNIEDLFGNSGFEFINCDVTRSSLTLLSKGKKIKEIYHLASPASPEQYQKDPIATWKANTIGAMNLLELAKQHRAKFLFASTSEVYGDPLEHPQKESYRGNVNPVGPRACYDEGKRAGEALCMDYFRKFNLSVKIVRIFNTYGPKMDKNDGRVVSNFIVQALKHKPLTVYGSGKQTRSFQYVDDLVSGLVKMMASGQNITGPVNLGNPHEFTVLQLAKKIIHLTKSKSKIAHKALPEDDPRQRKPDISLAGKKLKWVPKIELEEGLSRTIKYFNHQR